MIWRHLFSTLDLDRIAPLIQRIPLEFQSPPTPAHFRDLYKSSRRTAGHKMYRRLAKPKQTKEKGRKGFRDIKSIIRSAGLSDEETDSE